MKQKQHRRKKKEEKSHEKKKWEIFLKIIESFLKKKTKNVIASSYATCALQCETSMHFNIFIIGTQSRRVWANVSFAFSFLYDSLLLFFGNFGISCRWKSSLFSFWKMKFLNFDDWAILCNRVGYVCAFFRKRAMRQVSYFEIDTDAFQRWIEMKWKISCWMSSHAQQQWRSMKKNSIETKKENEEISSY